jgi:hypothetical protein
MRSQGPAPFGWSISVFLTPASCDAFTYARNPYAVKRVSVRTCADGESLLSLVSTARN